MLFRSEILNPAIASPKAISEIQTILEKVVSEGLGKKAGSKQFHVSGKTCTAQVSQGKAGYTNGTRRYLVSFCGYFHSEAPKYSCIVAIQKPGDVYKRQVLGDRPPMIPTFVGKCAGGTKYLNDRDQAKNCLLYTSRCV